MRKKTSAIYMIQNLKNHKLYVGGTTNVKSRKRQHFFELRNNVHKNWKIQGEFNEFGEDAFEFVVLENLYHMNGNELIEREQAWIDTLSPEYNLNRVAGSFIGENVFSEDSIEKRKISMRGRKSTDEHRRKISEGLSRHYADPENRAKLKKTPEQKEHFRWLATGERNGNWGKKRPQEFKDLISNQFSKEYTFVSPDGREVTFKNLLRNGETETGLPYWKLRQLYRGRKKEHQGWRYKQ